MSDHQQVKIDRESVCRTTTRSIAELHITGGVRAVEHAERLWLWGPVLHEGIPRDLAPMPIGQVSGMAREVGLLLFGADQQHGLDTPLVSRIWTPLNGPNAGGLQTADVWKAIGGNAERSGDIDYGTFAHHIGYSLNAAGIRLRDASDGYNAQLVAAIDQGTRPGRRYANLPMLELQLAFHSVLSELASARDYLAAATAKQLGAPSRIDAMNRFADWFSASSREDFRAQPLVSAMLQAYDSASKDPWLFQLTSYRNLFLHHHPLGSSGTRQMLTYDVQQKGEIGYPRILMPLSDNDPYAPGEDALTRFIGLYRSMTDLLRLAAEQAPYEPVPETFVIG